MVAREAGVSETIVSYVVNNNRYVDKHKRQRVLEAIDRLGYRPNAAARMLKFKKSNHLIFVADHIDNEHFGKLLAEMDRLLYNKGYFISLVQNRNDDEFIQHIISRQFDGVIVSSISMREEHIKTLCDAGVPVVVLMNRDYPDLPEAAGRVYPGLYEGARQCVRHLYAGGGRHIFYIDRISQRNHFSDALDLRLAGFVDEMRALGLSGDDNIITGCKTEEEVVGRIVAMVNSGVPLDAVFARNDRMAVIVMQAVKRLGLSIPGDVSVIGFDNSNLSRNISPPLTTMEINREAVAGAAIAVLQSLFKTGSAEPVKLQTSLIVRETTR